MRASSGLPLALTVGDPAGIGPDVVLAGLAAGLAAPVLVIGDRTLLEQRAKQLGLEFSLAEYDEKSGSCSSLLQVDLSNSVQAGKPEVANAGHVLQQLDLAHQLASSGRAAGIVTGPVNKALIEPACPGFRGHTGHFARLCGRARAVMAFVGPRIRGALVTEHIRLRDVADAISQEAVLETLTIAAAGIDDLLGGKSAWKVCGLNPHAGEDGLLGDEDRDCIAPAVRQANERGIDAIGPVSADSAFVDDARCVLAMYHDQLLPAVKRDGFLQTVNVTFGLSYPRTSVGHGTAYELAGSGRADCSSLCAAVALLAGR